MHKGKPTKQNQNNRMDDISVGSTRSLRWSRAHTALTVVQCIDGSSCRKGSIDLCPGALTTKMKMNNLSGRRAHTTFGMDDAQNNSIHIAHITARHRNFHCRSSMSLWTLNRQTNTHMTDPHMQMDGVRERTKMVHVNGSEYFLCTIPLHCRRLRRRRDRLLHLCLHLQSVCLFNECKRRKYVGASVAFYVLDKSRRSQFCPFDFILC